MKQLLPFSVCLALAYLLFMRLTPIVLNPPVGTTLSASRSRRTRRNAGPKPCALLDPSCFVPSRLRLAARQTGYFSAILLKSNAEGAQTAYGSRARRIARSARWRRHRFSEINLRFGPGASPINRPGRHMLRIPARHTPES